MKTRILLILFIAISFTTYSQDSSFQLKDYKYRTPGFRSLTINIDFRGNIDSRKLPSASINGIQKIFDLTPSTLQYYKTSSTDKKLSTESYYISPSLSFITIQKDLNKVKSTTSKAYFDARHLYRYYKLNQWFFELNNQLVGSLSGIRGSDTSNVTNTTNEFNVRDIFTIGYGKGRIEAVQDAQMAMFILDDLEETGLLENEISPEITREFAILVTEINNKRIFDSRRRRIYELTQLESFLRTKGLVVENTDIRHFTILNDNWAFATIHYDNPGQHGLSVYRQLEI